MSQFIEILNHYGKVAVYFAWPMLWQSSALIAVLFVADFALRRQVRAAVRYALWLVVLLKLLLPPSLALPTGVAWWLFPAAAPTNPQTTRYVVTYGPDIAPDLPLLPAAVFTPPRPPISAAAWGLLAWGTIGTGLLVWLIARWRQVDSDVKRAMSVPAWLGALFDETKDASGLRRTVRLRLTDRAMSPAVCGLFRPVILLPQSLVQKLPPAQLRAVLLHELTHLRRGDVWMNCAQALAQIVYWWHPLLWLANARIRRVREEAVDDAVMLALRDDAEAYAPTLLEVAKLAFHRPLASLGLVGILESRSALRQRIERLVNFHAPRKAGLTIASLLGILAFTALAVPMGEAPPTSSNTNDVVRSETAAGKTPEAPPAKTDSETAGTATMTFKIDRPPDADSLKKLLLDAGVKIPPTVYFYTDNGFLLVRGDEKQLALVHSAVLKLNGFLPKEIPAETNVSEGFRERLDAIVERSHQNTPAGFGKTETMPDASRNAPPLVFSGITNKTTSSAGASTNLETRTFKVDANVFLANLQKQAGWQTNASAAMRQLLLNVGVDLSPPKSIFYNDRMGVLFAHATEQDLDVVEKAVQVLDYTPPPQIHIKARFIEVPEPTAQYFGTYLIPTGATNVAGILTDPNFRVVIHTIEQRAGTEELAEPEVTTISGRQTQMRATDILTIITNFVFQETSTNSTITPKQGQVEVGPVLDVIPVVLSDGYTIDLRTIASLTEFLGYDKPPTNSTPVVTSTGAIVDVPNILPRFSVRQAVAHVKLWDNQTVVLGGLISAQTITINEDTVPVSGSRSAGEPLSRKQTTIRTSPKKQLLVLITATMVDAAGNRIHSDDELSSARKSIPPQDSH